MTIFFTSDTHFGHANLVLKGHRPYFSSVEEMDEHLIRRWNAVVTPRDIVYHLGDFTLHGADVAQDYLSRLNGFLHLVCGNHDRNSVKKLTRWDSVRDYAEVKVDGQRIVLCHYAMRVWNRCHHGALMLHGHSHGNLKANNQSIDVGVDYWDFQPVTLNQIIKRLAVMPPFRSEDHHVP